MKRASTTMFVVIKNERNGRATKRRMSLENAFGDLLADPFKEAILSLCQII